MKHMVLLTLMSCSHTPVPCLTESPDDALWYPRMVESTCENDRYYGDAALKKRRMWVINAWEKCGPKLPDGGTDWSK